MREFFRKWLSDPWMNIIVFGLLFLFAIGGVLTYVKNSVPEPDEKGIESEVNAPSANGPETRIIGEEFTGPVIRYTDEGFSPKSISLSKEDRVHTSCAIKIVNDSSGELLVRLGPPAEKDNRGFPYPSVPKGQSILIDPRYSGIFKAEFYNRHLPVHTVEVTLDPACFE